LTAEYPPLWPGFLSIGAFFGIDSETGLRLFAAFVGAAGVVIGGLLGRRVGGPAVGLVAAGVLALHPLVFQSDATLMPETLFFGLTGAMVLLALAARDEPSWRLLGGLGLVGGLATLTRAEGALLLVLLVVPFVRMPEWPRRLGIVALAAAAVLVPWTARNLVRLDAFVPVSNNLGTALDGANCDPMWHGETVGLWAFEPQCFDGFEQDDLVEDGEAAVAAHHRDEGLEYVGDHLGSLPRVAVVRILRTWGLWNPEQQTFAASFEGRDLDWERAGTAFHLIALLPLAAGGLIVLGRRRAAWWPLAAPLVSVTVTAAVTYGNQRFRAGAEPALAVLAAVAVVALVGRLRAPARPAVGSPPP
jgi:4-amino-4-deoxy-L-arabinose transferase-like glycosyltransferase